MSLLKPIAMATMLAVLSSTLSAQRVPKARLLPVPASEWTDAHREALGTRARIVRRGKGGRIEIDFADGTGAAELADIGANDGAMARETDFKPGGIGLRAVCDF